MKREKCKEDVKTTEVGSTEFRSSKVWKLESRKRKGESGIPKCRSRNSEMQKCRSQKKLVFRSQSMEAGSAEVRKWKLEVGKSRIFLNKFLKTWDLHPMPNSDKWSSRAQRRSMV